MQIVMTEHPPVQAQDTSFGTFFGMLNGYRVSLLLMLIARSRIMERVAPDGASIMDLTRDLGWDSVGAERFITVLVELGFLQRSGDYLLASPFSRRFLWSGSADAQLRTLQFEEHLLQNWLKLEDAVQNGTRIPAPDKTPEEYERHLSLFLDAMNEAARQRSEELWHELDLKAEGTIVEIGAGSGAYLAACLERYDAWRGIFVDLPDVVSRGRASERLQALGERVSWREWNFAQDPAPEGMCGDADVVLLSNVLHCQGPDPTYRLLDKLLAEVNDNCLLVLHDFYTDANWHGALYDFHMLVNTPTGRTYSLTEMTGFLKANGFACSIRNLPSFSAAVFASRSTQQVPDEEPTLPVVRKARALGFDRAVPFVPEQIPVCEWVVEKCRTGCKHYGKTASCPPHSRSPEETKILLSGYEKAVLLLGQPPLKEFQENLLELECIASENGFRKALALGAGHCSICSECKPDDCRHPSRRRFSLESCGCDVYGLCKNLGIDLAPVTRDQEFVQYVAVLLLE